MRRGSGSDALFRVILLFDLLFVFGAILLIFRFSLLLFDTFRFLKVELSYTLARWLVLDTVPGTAVEALFAVMAGRIWLLFI